MPCKPKPPVLPPETEGDYSMVYPFSEEEYIRSGRQRWYGHAMRNNYEDWVKNCTEFRVEGGRPE